MYSEELGSRACVCVDGVDEGDISFLESVIVVNCGGTINMSLAPVRGPAGVVEKKLGNIKREMESKGVRVQSESIFLRPPDSSNIGELEWNLILNKLKDICDRKDLIAQRLKARGVKLEMGGVVVAHGTDTLQVTALIVALEFSIRSLNVPIVFTASHSPIEAAGSDGLTNLRKSLFIAKERFVSESPNLPPAVYVLIGQDVHLASRLMKVRTMPDSDGRYFFSFPAPVGRITAGAKFRLRIDDTFLSKMLPGSPVLLGSDSPRRLFGIVEHLYVDRFSNILGLEDVKSRASFYRSEIPLEKRGIAFVVQGDFSANSELPDISRLLGDISREAPVFVGSLKSFTQVRKVTGGGNIFLLPKSMTHAKAQAKLRWLLSFSELKLEISSALNANFAGEVFESTELPEWINYETFPNKTAGTEVVIVYPNIHWKVLEHAIRRLQASGQVGRRLFLFGFGDGHVPSINQPIGKVVGRYVDRDILGDLVFDSEVSVDSIVGQLASHIRDMPTHQLKDFLSWKYLIDEKKLKGILIGEFSQEIIERELAKIKKTIESVMDRMTRDRPVSIENKNQVIDAMIKNTRIAGFEDEARKFMQDVPMEWSHRLVDILKSKCPELVVRRIIKDSVMASDLLLNYIGVAVDLGIDCKIRSLAVKSRTNTLNYEPGNILMALGVDSEEASGWKTRYLKPRQNNLRSNLGATI
jgi:hypothetical protein